MADATYQPKVYRTDGGDKQVVADGGVLDIETGGAFKLAGTAVAASATELDEYCVNAYMADAGTAGSVFVVAPHAGVISKLSAVSNAANATTKTVLLAKIATVTVTAPAWEFSVTLAAGTASTVTPTAARTVAAGDVIELVSDGGSSTVMPTQFTVTIAR